MSEIEKNPISENEKGEKSFRPGKKISRTEENLNPSVLNVFRHVLDNRESKLDISGQEITHLPDSIFTEYTFLENIFLYTNHMCSLPSSIGQLQHLTSLMAQENQLQLLPRELGKLKNLEVLDFRHNRLTDECIEPIFQLGNLRQCFASFNRIKAMEGDFSHLSNLECLKLDHNGPKLVLSPTIGELKKLTYLDLSHCGMLSLPSSISMCKSLINLHLQNNQLQELPENIGDLVNLQRLNLRNNMLKHLPESLKQCTKLTEFSLESNHLTQIPNGLFQQMHDLIKINLGRNFFNDMPSSDSLETGRQQYEFIKEFVIDNNKITRIPVGTFEGATAINKLVLRDNEINSLEGCEIRNWRSLVELDLCSNCLSVLPDEIGYLNNLQILRLSFNSLKMLPSTVESLHRLTQLELDNNELMVLPVEIGRIITLEELNVSNNRLTHFPVTVGQLNRLKVLRANENSLRELPMEIGRLESLVELYLNDNRDLAALPAELSHCSKLYKLVVTGCNLSELPRLVVDGGSAMIMFFLSQVILLRQQS